MTSILGKSRAFNGTQMGGVQSGIHDYEYQACKVVTKEGLSERRLKLIENEIIN